MYDLNFSSLSGLEIAALASAGKALHGGRASLWRYANRRPSDLVAMFYWVLGQSIMEDFEWKLHEMEKDYNAKLKYSKEKIDEQIKEACRGILREKDDEINKLQIKVR